MFHLFHLCRQSQSHLDLSWWLHATVQTKNWCNINCSKECIAMITNSYIDIEHISDQIHDYIWYIVTALTCFKNKPPKLKALKSNGFGLEPSTIDGIVGRMHIYIYVFTYIYKYIYIYKPAMTANQRLQKMKSTLSNLQHRCTFFQWPLRSQYGTKSTAQA